MTTAGAGDAVTRPELEAELAKLKTDLVERMAAGEAALRTQIAEGGQSLRTHSTEGDQSLRAQLAETDQSLRDRIAESERRHAALLWRLFGGIVATAGVAVAAARFLPVVSVVG